MRLRTKLAVLAAFAVALGCTAVALPRVREALGVLAAGVGAAGLALARFARKAWRLVAGQAGTVEGQGDPWIPDPEAKDRIIVEAHGETVAVTLPAGVDRDRIRAVTVGEGGPATVEVVKW